MKKNPLAATAIISPCQGDRNHYYLPTQSEASQIFNTEDLNNLQYSPPWGYSDIIDLNNYSLTFERPGFTDQVWYPVYSRDGFAGIDLGASHLGLLLPASLVLTSNLCEDITHHYGIIFRIGDVIYDYHRFYLNKPYDKIQKLTFKSGISEGLCRSYVSNYVDTGSVYGLRYNKYLNQYEFTESIK